MNARLAKFGPWLLGGLLIALTFLAYQPAWHGGFLWDDDAYVTGNRLLTAPDGWQKIWLSLSAPSQYFPLVYSSFRLELPLWGSNTTGYHLVNLALHAANALLVWRLLQRLGIPGAWLAAFVFVLHPVQVESVAWITERKNVLMGLFFLSSLIAWCRFLDQHEKRRALFYGLALASYFLALTAKTTACTLPAAQLLILWWRHLAIDKRRLLQLAPFVVAGALMGMVTVWWERFHQGTRGALFSLGPLERLLIAARGFWFYLGKLAYPARLTFIYPRWQIQLSDPTLYLWLAACLLLLFGVWRARARLGRGPETALLFFAATLSPLLGFIMLYTFRYTFVADHYQYVACIGPIALAAGAFVRLCQVRQLSPAVGRAIGVLVVAILFGLTWRQARIYRDIETLWGDTIAKNPNCWMAYNNLGIVQANRADETRAISSYRKAIELYPDYPASHYNLANALLSVGDLGEATRQARTAVQLQPNDPDGRIALANALLAGGRVADAAAAYRRACELAPESADAHYGLASALQQQGESNAAISEFETALRVAPELVDARLNLANVLFQSGREKEAITEYQRVLQSEPNSALAQSNLAWARSAARDLSLRNGREAVRLAEQASRAFGDRNALALHTLAAALAENGQFDQAITVAEKALELSGASDDPLVDELRREIALYQQGLSYRQP